MSLGSSCHKILEFWFGFHNLLELLSKSFKITLIDLHYALQVSELATFVLETCRFVEFSNEKSLSFGAKILEFEFLGP